MIARNQPLPCANQHLRFMICITIKGANHENILVLALVSVVDWGNQIEQKSVAKI